MTTDVIVIGAGAAGLGAALDLARSGFSVALLEARSRIGGRVYWVPLGDSPAELGAEFIHGPARETRRILKEAGLETERIGGEGWRFDSTAGLRPDAREFEAASELFDGVRMLERDESVEAYLQRFSGDESMREVVRGARAFAEGFDAADPHLASAFGIADEWHSGTDDTSVRPRGGYGPMFEYLHRACVQAGVDVRLETPVNRVAWKRGGVLVDGMRASAAIVTVPVAILRAGDIAFEPALPEAKQTAMRGIETGSVVKVMLRYSEPFWRHICGGRYRNAAFFRPEGRAFGAYWTRVSARDALVCAWLGGPRAAAMLGVPHEEIVARAARDFAGCFGEAAYGAEPVEAALHDWDADAYARGAYSYLAVGGRNARAGLAEPLDGSLFFAGEATATGGQGGTVNGALASGQRAAAEAAMALDAKPHETNA